MLQKQRLCGLHPSRSETQSGLPSPVSVRKCVAQQSGTARIERLLGEHHRLFRADRVGTSIVGAVKPRNRTTPVTNLGGRRSSQSRTKCRHFQTNL